MNVLKKLSQHFSLAEAEHSDTAIANGITNCMPEAAILIAEKTALGMERVRAALGNKPIQINSWYRSTELNAAIGSKPTSQHILGEAVDFTCPAFGAPVSICKKLVELKDLIRYDQLIMEGTWVHISFAISTGKPRYQVLSLLRNGTYALGITDKQGHPL
jgi:hypothetical protein